MPEAALLWAEDLAPSELLALDRDKVKGLLLARGGLTSHTIILARAFSLPVLTGVQRAAIADGIGRTAVLDAGLGPCSRARIRSCSITIEKKRRCWLRSGNDWPRPAAASPPAPTAIGWSWR
ncbi:PEP-utilizing enzyme [Chromobacterium vaccinii]|uniref:PEP-utilizing enzyme n=1 Tax=Chromobacterium vaccinii TaxID=1108595 RepID=UPI001642D1E8